MFATINGHVRVGWVRSVAARNFSGASGCSGAFAESYYKNVTKEAILVPRSEISAPVIAHIYLSACGTASAEPREDPELEHRTAAIHQQTP